ncbi:MAG: 3'-5' exonuclease, partial [Actinomycetota bacterium]
YQVRDGAFLRRPGPRTALRKLARADQNGPATDLVTAAATELGWHPFNVPDEGAGQEEVTRLADLGRLVRLAEEFEGSLAAFLTDLRLRFEDENGRGVVLSTYHRAKGLEWGAVFLPRLEEREMPFALSKSDDEVAEERRLLYVGITRARSHLRVSWARERDGRRVRPSRFLDELRPGTRVTRTPSAKTNGDAAVDSELFAKLRAWRKKVADAAEVPAYVVFPDKTLHEICDRSPKTLVELSRVSGVGPTKLSRYGNAVLQLVLDA